MESLRATIGQWTIVFALLAIFTLGPHAEINASQDISILRNATLITIVQSEPFVGTIVIEDGKITAVIREDDDQPIAAEVLDRATEYDLSGYTITPGFIDCRSVLHLEPGAAAESSSNAGLSITTGIDPFSDDWQEVASQGITTVGVRPSGSLGGYAAALRVTPSQQLSEIILKDEIALVATIGLNANSSPARFQEFNRLKTAIGRVVAGEKAEKEKEEKEAEEEADQKKEESEGPSPAPAPTPSTDSAPAARVAAPSRVNDLLKRVVKKEIPLHIRVKHSDVIGWVLEMQEEFDLRIVLEDLTEGTRHAQKIDDLNIPLIIGPFGWVSESVSDSRKNFDAAWVADFAAQGGIVAISPFSSQSRGSRLLRLNVAAALAEIPFTRVDALKAVTINAARILGIADQVGTIEVGKRADLAIFAGDPLDPSTPVRLVFSGGELIFESNLDAPKSTFESTQPLLSIELPVTLPDRYGIRSKFIYQGGELAEGTIIINHDKIESIRPSAEDQDDTLSVYDLGEAIVTPGLVAAYSHLGHQSQLGGNPESDATLFRSVDLFDSDRKPVRQMMAAGFLNIGFAPLPTNTSAGAVGQLRLTSLPQVMDPQIASQFVLSSEARNNERYPASLTGQHNFVSELLDLRFPQSRLYVTAAMENILEMEKQEMISRLQTKDARALFVVGNALEAALAADVARKHDLTATLRINAISSEMTNELLDSKLGVILPSANGNEYDSYFQQVIELINGGVEIGFAGETAAEIRATASLLASQGACQVSLLRALTEGGAAIVGMSPDTAKLQPGSRADLVIWNRSPLDMSAKPVAIVVDGKRNIASTTSTR